MPSGYEQDLADSAQAHKRARTHQRCEGCERKPPDVVVVVHHRDERGVAGRRALGKTTSARCRGCHQLEHGRRPPARR